jgi:hypothetical protein
MDRRSTDFQYRRQTDEITNDVGEEHNLDLRAQLPEIPTAENDRTITLSVQIEGMINYRLDQTSQLFAQLKSITFPKLRLTTTLIPANGDPR